MEPWFEDDESVGSASFPTDGCVDDRDGLGECPGPRHQPPTRLPGYCLGESSRNSWDMQVPADELRLHDYAFVKRTDGTWTYAILAERFFRDPDEYEERRTERRSASDEEHMVFVISASGRTKQLRREEWWDCIRLVNANRYDAKASSSTKEAETNRGDPFQEFDEIEEEHQVSESEDIEATCNGHTGTRTNSNECDAHAQPQVNSIGECGGNGSQTSRKRRADSQNMVMAALTASMRIEEKQLQKELKKEKEKQERDLKAREKEFQQRWQKEPEQERLPQGTHEYVDDVEVLERRFMEEQKEMQRKQFEEEVRQRQLREEQRELQRTQKAALTASMRIEEKQLQKELKKEKEKQERDGKAREKELQQRCQKEPQQERITQDKREYVDDVGALERRFMEEQKEMQRNQFEEEVRQRRLREEQKELQRKQFKEQMAKRKAGLSASNSSGGVGLLKRTSHFNPSDSNSSEAASAGRKLLQRRGTVDVVSSLGLSRPSVGLSSRNRLASGSGLPTASSGLSSRNSTSGLSRPPSKTGLSCRNKMSSSVALGAHSLSDSHTKLASSSIGDFRQKIKDRQTRASGRTKDNFNWGYF